MSRMKQNVYIKRTIPSFWVSDCVAEDKLKLLENLRMLA